MLLLCKFFCAYKKMRQVTSSVFYTFFCVTWMKLFPARSRQVSCISPASRPAGRAVSPVDLQTRLIKKSVGQEFLKLMRPLCILDGRQEIITKIIVYITVGVALLIDFMRLFSIIVRYREPIQRIYPKLCKLQ